MKRQNLSTLENGRGDRFAILFARLAIATASSSAFLGRIARSTTTAASRCFFLFIIRHIQMRRNVRLFPFFVMRRLFPQIIKINHLMRRFAALQGLFANQVKILAVMRHARFKEGNFHGRPIFPHGSSTLWTLQKAQRRQCWQGVIGGRAEKTGRRQHDVGGKFDIVFQYFVS